MKVSSHHFSESFGTDEKSALKSIKQSEPDSSVSQVTKNFETASAAKAETENPRSELQHRVLGREVKNELSSFSQLKAAELTSKLNKSNFEGLTKKFEAPEGSSARFSEMTEVLLSKDHVVAAESTSGTKVDKAIEGITNVKVDPGKEIENMKDGDKITVGGGVSVALAEDAKIGVKGNIELSKEGNKYKLSVDGETAASMGVGIGAGAKVEMSFDNPDDAKRALGLAKSSKIKDVGRLANVQAGGLQFKDLAPVANKTSEDAEFLNKHISAMEVKQSWITEVPGMNVEKMGLPNSASAKAESTLRFEYENGKPKYMILKNGGVGETYPGGKGAVSIEQKFQIDENFPIGKMTSKEFKDPNKDLTPAEKDSLKRAMASAEYSVNIEAEMRQQDSNKGVGVRTQIKLSGKPQDFQTPETQEAIRKMAQEGKIKDGLKTVGNKINVEGKAEVYQSTGIDTKSPEFGVGIELQATRQRVLSSKTVTQRSASQAAEDVGQAIEDAKAKAKGGY